MSTPANSTDPATAKDTACSPDKALHELEAAPKLPPDSAPPAVAMGADVYRKSRPSLNESRLDLASWRSFEPIPYRPASRAPCEAAALSATSFFPSEKDGQSATKQVTPGDHIHESTIPPSKPSPETGVEGISLGRREPWDAGGGRGDGIPITSTDVGFLSSGDVELDGGLAALGSGDFVEGILFSDGAAAAETAASSLEATKYRLTAARVGDKPLSTSGERRRDEEEGVLFPDGAATAALEAAGYRRPAAHAVDKPSRTSSERRMDDEDQDDFCPVLKLTADMERISTGEEVTPLRERMRISSRDWIKDFEGETTANLGPMHPSLFMDSGARCNADHFSASLPQLSLPASNYEAFQLPLSSGYVPSPVPPPPNASIMLKAPNDDTLTTSLEKTNGGPSEEFQIPLSSEKAPSPVPRPPNSSIMLKPPTDGTPTASLETAKPEPSASSAAGKKKRRKKRTIDESRAFTPTVDDVLFGRGGFTNSHPGNIRFRERALSYRKWYEQPSTPKEEKYKISDLLVASVRDEGHRFLEKGADGLWHEVIGNGARKKASQALRERIKGTRVRTRPLGNNVGGIRSAGSGEGEDASEEVLGDLMPDGVEVEDMTGDVEGV